MKSQDAKKLIGKPIKYNRIHSPYLWWQYATILDVKGNNVLVDEMGMTDWLWLPDVHIVLITPDND